MKLTKDRLETPEFVIIFPQLLPAYWENMNSYDLFSNIGVGDIFRAWKFKEESTVIQYTLELVWRFVQILIFHFVYDDPD